MKTAFLIGIALCVVVLAGCSGHGRISNGQENSDTTGICVPRYAKGFSVRTTAEGVHLVDVADPQTDEDRMPVSYRFALVPHGCQAQVPEGYTRVEVPIERCIVMTMLQMSNFTALDAHDVISGVTGVKNLFDSDIKGRVKRGDIVKIGMEGNFDTELILAANPEVIFISPFKRGGYDVVKETGITLVPHLGYKELDPLGQAEWVKYVGMFVGKEQEADSLFRGIEARYLALKEKAAGVTERPTVFSGEMHGGNWYAVGGKNYLAQIFRDAGADYVIDDDNTGGVNIDYEQMYATAAEADYWRILNSFEGDFTYDALLSSEPRNALFRAFKERHVIYCNMKQTPYYEISPVKPDAVLADFVAIFHPELMPADYEPTFYHLLK
ncbi:MAG: ABC transporter substrate-binding protein [Bacteroidaceae bacterium]|nr:ABC transporter substrate-binding protein [Bacteroidaceae bacterium]